MLDQRKKYLQIALNNTLSEAERIISQLPLSDRLLIEAGTPLIKRYGQEGIVKIKQWWQQRILQGASPAIATSPYIVADLKCMDRGQTEVALAKEAGADAVVALGSVPIETLDIFIARCEAAQLDAMIDMMNVEYPVQVLSQLKKTTSSGDFASWG